MSSSSLLPRKLIILAVVLPIAAVVGYQLADPDLGSFTFFGLLLSVLSLPIFLRWHHLLLVFSWNAAMQVFFLPGQPLLWMLFAGVSLMFSILGRLLVKKEQETNVRSVIWPLIVLSLVVLITAALTGGIGLRVLGGSAYGGKRYVYFVAAVIGYFALAAQRIPPSHSARYVACFFLSFITAAVGHVLYLLGPSFWFLYAVFPVGYAGYQAVADFTGSEMVRLAGLTFAGLGICKFLLCRFGIQGLLLVEKPWRLLAFLVSMLVMLLGGFRSGLLTLGILCVVLFFLEGLHRTRLVIAVAIGIVLIGAATIPLATKMPLSIQRALALFPVNVSPVARADALASSEWRIKMWKVLWPDVPKYLWLGKGSAINPSDLYLVAEAMRRGQAEQHESALVAGDYHSAPLSLVIQFGIWGVAAFVWFCLASLRVLYQNHRYSSPQLKLCNRFLLAYFITQLLCFAIILGSFADHFYLFTGIIGFSVSLNGGVRQPPADKSPELPNA